MDLYSFVAGFLGGMAGVIVSALVINSTPPRYRR